MQSSTRWCGVGSCFSSSPNCRSGPASSLPPRHPLHLLAFLHPFSALLLPCPSMASDPSPFPLPLPTLPLLTGSVSSATTGTKHSPSPALEQCCWLCTAITGPSGGCPPCPRLEWKLSLPVWSKGNRWGEGDGRHRAEALWGRWGAGTMGGYVAGTGSRGQTASSPPSSLHHFSLPSLLPPHYLLPSTYPASCLCPVAPPTTCLWGHLGGRCKSG